MFDRFNRRIHYLRISVTDRCNLSCGYCMPEEGIPFVGRDQILSFEEIRALVAVAVGMGVTKVRLTGGEPLVRRGILDLVHMLAEIPGIKDLCMTSNGILLSDYALPLCQAGLGRINISLDTVDPARFRDITGGGDVSQVLAGIEAARNSGLQPVKLNCVVTDSPDEIDALGVANYARDCGLEVRFIRRMDLKTGRFWPITGSEGGHCKICSRLRVSSDGRIFPCLFDNTFFSIREHGIETALRLAVENKPEAGNRSDMGIHALGG
jgi:cyclic pyranopterin phosphate synthase